MNKRAYKETGDFCHRGIGLFNAKSLVATLIGGGRLVVYKVDSFCYNFRNVLLYALLIGVCTSCLLYTSDAADE